MLSVHQDRRWFGQAETPQIQGLTVDDNAGSHEVQLYRGMADVFRSQRM